MLKSDCPYILDLFVLNDDEYKEKYKAIEEKEESKKDKGDSKIKVDDLEMAPIEIVPLKKEEENGQKNIKSENEEQNNKEKDNKIENGDKNKNKKNIENEKNIIKNEKKEEKEEKIGEVKKEEEKKDENKKEEKKE